MQVAGLDSRVEVSEQGYGQVELGGVFSHRCKGRKTGKAQISDQVLLVQAESFERGMRKTEVAVEDSPGESAAS